MESKQTTIRFKLLTYQNGLGETFFRVKRHHFLCFYTDIAYKLIFGSGWISYESFLFPTRESAIQRIEEIARDIKYEKEKFLKNKKRLELKLIISEDIKI